MPYNCPIGSASMIFSIFTVLQPSLKSNVSIFLSTKKKLCIQEQSLLNVLSNLPYFWFRQPLIYFLLLFDFSRYFLVSRIVCCIFVCLADLRIFHIIICIIFLFIAEQHSIFMLIPWLVYPLPVHGYLDYFQSLVVFIKL